MKQAIQHKVERGDGKTVITCWLEENGKRNGIVIKLNGLANDSVIQQAVSRGSQRVKELVL